MKRIFIILSIILISMGVFAKSISIEEAKTVANNFLNFKSKSSVNIAEIKYLLSDKEIEAYLFQLTPDGFIAVTSDSDVTPVLAYSFNNKLTQDKDNLIYTMLTDDIKKRKQYNTQQTRMDNHNLWNDFLSNTKDNRDFQQWPADGSTETDGWVTKQWNQSGVFNRMCPKDNSGQRSVVGCVATAMAMIVDFHHYVGNVQFSDADDYTSGWNDEMHLDDDHEEREYPSFPELNPYLVTLREDYENGVPLTNDDKASLCFACGISVHMIYSSEGSGAWTSEVADALLNKFGYISAYHQDNEGSDFYDVLRANMKTMQPAEISIYHADYSAGHAIICDGYNTNDYYHLNYGWGTSNNNCWYILPEGMPAGYAILTGGVVNIEGGDIPVSVSGSVNITGDSPNGTYIRFEGDGGTFESYVTSNSGSYQIPAMRAGTYTATAVKERLYYSTQIVTIDASNNVVNFEMGYYDALNGTVSAPINPVGTAINIYKDGELEYSGVCQNSSGAFSINSVLPGSYTATASLNGNYFQSKEFEVTADNQVVNFNLEEYSGNIFSAYHKTMDSKWSLVPNRTFTCGIKLDTNIEEQCASYPLAKVSFLAPISSSEGQIWVQVWEDNNLLSEKEVTEFSEGEWVTQNLDSFVVIDPEKNYYASYKIISQTADYAYCDNGPQLAGKGALIHTTNWIAIPASSLDKNFCIEAGFISQDYATITGHISTDDDWQSLEQGVIKAGNYTTHSNSNGDYTLILKEGNYDITAMMPDHIEQVITNVSAINGETTANIDFNLLWGTSNDEDIIHSEMVTLSSYPNPFTQGNGKSNITIKYSGKIANPIIKIYNLKGECVKTINAQNQKSVIWDAKDSVGKSISSGIYFYRLIDNKKILKTKKLVIIK